MLLGNVILLTGASDRLLIGLLISKSVSQKAQRPTLKGPPGFNSTRSRTEKRSKFQESWQFFWRTSYYLLWPYWGDPVTPTAGTTLNLLELLLRSLFWYCLF
jgi:hypothetical protein